MTQVLSFAQIIGTRVLAHVHNMDDSRDWPGSNINASSVVLFV